MRTRFSVVLVLAALVVPTCVLAQRAPVAGAALVHLEGEVFLNERVVESNSAPSVLPDSVVLRTGQGRAVVTLKRGGFLFLDAGTSVLVAGNGVYNFNRIEVHTGSAIVASETSAPLVDCENGIRLSDAGIFRFDVHRVNATGERSCRFRVFEGAAAVPLVSLINAMRAGQAMMCNRRCGDKIQTEEFSRDQLDDFDQWARRTHERLRK